jgi:hypothetical protein
MYGSVWQCKSRKVLLCEHLPSSSKVSAFSSVDFYDMTYRSSCAALVALQLCTGADGMPGCSMATAGCSTARHQQLLRGVAPHSI